MTDTIEPVDLDEDEKHRSPSGWSTKPGSRCRSARSRWSVDRVDLTVLLRTVVAQLGSLVRAGEGCDRPVVAVGVGHREITGRVLGLLDELVHDGRVQRACPGHDRVRSAVTTWSELVPGRHVVVRSPVLDSRSRPPFGQPGWQ
jgi:hypothetical protein